MRNKASAWHPYEVAADYLASKRDPAVLERQHPEMREAALLLVGLFDQGAAGPLHQDQESDERLSA